MGRRRAGQRPRTAAATVRPSSAVAQRAMPAIVLALAVAATYANSLSGAFVLDDQAAIVQNVRIRDLSRMGDVLVPEADSPTAGRPLASLSLAVNYAAGGLDVGGYHVVNIALHFACALLLMALVRRTVGQWNAAHGGSIDARQVSFAAALLWAVHPLTSEVVNYVSQRTESLMAIGYLGTMYAAVRAATGRAVQARVRWEAAAVAAGVGGALCKESIATVPLAVVLFDRVFLFESWRAQWEARRRLYAGLASIWVVVALVIASGARAAVAGFGSGVSPWTYLLNQAEIVTTYLRLVVWPDALVAFYGWPRPVTVRDVVPQLVLIAALLVATTVALRKWPPFGFLGAWFFITLAPASSIVPVTTEVGAERRMYLPLATAAVLASLALEAIGRRASRRAAHDGVVRGARAGPVIAGLLIAVALGAVTAARNEEYGTPLTLARTIVERRPTAVAHHMYGEELVRAGHGDEALVHLRRAVELGNSRARYLLGQLLASEERHAEAIEHLDAFVRTYRPPAPLVPVWLEPPLTEVVPARFLLGRAHGLLGHWDHAEEQARAILALVPSHIGAQGLLGDVMFARQRWREAIEHYSVYLQRQPNDVRAWLNYGVAHVAVERLDEAVAAFARAAELDPADARVRELLAMAQQDRAELAGR